MYHCIEFPIKNEYIIILNKYGVRCFEGVSVMNHFTTPLFSLCRLLIGD